MILEKLRLAPLFSKYNLVFWPRKSEQSKQAKKMMNVNVRSLRQKTSPIFHFFENQLKNVSMDT